MLQTNVLHLCQNGTMFSIMTTCGVNPWCWQLLLLTVAWIDDMLQHCVDMFCESIEQVVVSRVLHRKRFIKCCLWLVGLVLVAVVWVDDVDIGNVSEGHSLCHLFAHSGAQVCNLFMHMH